MYVSSRTRWAPHQRALGIAIGGALLASMLLLAVRADSAIALGRKCGIVRHALSELYSYDASVLALRVPCGEARALAEEWYFRLEAGELPDRTGAGEYAQYGHAADVLGFDCRWRRFGSDIGQVRCDAADRRVVTWGHHRSVGEDDPLPGYARIERPTLARFEAEFEVTDVLTRRFGEAYTYADQPVTRCARLSRRQFRCRTSWFMGDGLYDARVRVVLKRGSDGLEHKSSRGRARLIDEYCVHVTPRYNCTRTYTLRG